MTFKKTKLVLSIATVALTMGAALVSPQAMAHKAKKSHHHTSAQPSYSKVDALESQVRMMQEQIAALTAAQTTAAPVAAVDTAKVEELDQWMASVKAAPVIEKTKDNMVFFRGGYGRTNATRGGTVDPTSVPGLGLASSNGVVVGPITDKDAWYFGAGFDFSINNNLFGLMDDTEVLAELMFDYKQLGARGDNGLSPREVGVINTLGFNLPAANTQTATVNQLTLAASPKIKFMKGSSFRPWLIPVGFELNIISPPSDAITVMTPGMQFGFGADYKVWKDIYVGADARYHYAPSKVDGVDTNGFTAGGYLGLGF
jgi:outer membrane murein-binding lipoprotein Lpp